MSTTEIELTLNAYIRKYQDRFSKELYDIAQLKGLYVTRSGQGSVPIPISATVEVYSDKNILEYQNAANLLSSAAVKTAKYAINDSKYSKLLLPGFSPLERKFTELTGRTLDVLATTRIDFFGKRQSLKALEVNATIPAMQGYSDIANYALFKSVGSFLRISEATQKKMFENNGLNTSHLLSALMQGWSQLTKNRQSINELRIGILCRRDDSQLGELKFIEEFFNANGVFAHIVYPDELEFAKSPLKKITYDGKEIDLIYRHMFVRRIEELEYEHKNGLIEFMEQSNSHATKILNPPSSQVEAKLIFAIMNESIINKELENRIGLSPEEKHAIEQYTPWTRMFHDSSELLTEVKRNPHLYVLKRSWDYGGRAVFIGKESSGHAFNQKAELLWPDMIEKNWDNICERAFTDKRAGGFVVQRIVEVDNKKHCLVSKDGAKDCSVYVDFSMYGSVGVNTAPLWMGVCRASSSSVVNIMGGGGLVPIVRESLAAQLVKEFKEFDYSSPNV